jgi:hypothetical protein
MQTKTPAASRRPAIKAKSRPVRFKMPCIRHIVIHCTGTSPGIGINDLADVPYQYVITRDGKVLKFKEIERTHTTIDIAYLGGLDKDSNPCDNRTAIQSDGLFRVLLQLCELFSKAAIVGADELYDFVHANPGFDIKGWLSNYISEFLQTA